MPRNVEERQAAADAFAMRLRGVFEGFKARGLSQQEMAAELNQLGIKTAAGGETWVQAQVQRVLKRLSSE